MNCFRPVVRPQGHRRIRVSEGNAHLGRQKKDDVKDTQGLLRKGTVIDFHSVFERTSTVITSHCV